MPLVEIGASNHTRQLRIELSDCLLEVLAVSGSSVRILDYTLAPIFNPPKRSGVTLTDLGDCLVASCSGPSQTEGTLKVASLEIGREARLSETTIMIKSSMWSLLRMQPAPYGASIALKGTNVLVEMGGIDVPFSAQVASGLLDIRASPIPQARLDVGAAVVSIHTAVATRLVVATSGASTADASSKLCLSDAAGVPSVVKANASWASADFGGVAAVSRFTVFRGSGGAVGELFVTKGVNANGRSAQDNTYDSTGGVGYAVEASFHTWSARMFSKGFQILRVRLLAPGLDDDLGGVGAKGDWVYSAYGNTYVWHPMSYFWVNTLGLYSPPAARAYLSFTSAQCTPVHTPVNVCEVPSPLGSHNQDVLEGMSASLWQALPSGSIYWNSSKFGLYYVDSLDQHLSQSDDMLSFPSLADGRVVSFGSDTLVEVEANHEPSKFRDGTASTFVFMRLILSVGVPLLCLWSFCKLYVAERDKLIAREGQRLWPELWNAEVQRAQRKDAAGTPCAKSAQAPATPGSRVCRSPTPQVLRVLGFSRTNARKNIEKRADKIVGNSIFFLTMIETIMVTRGPKEYKVVGLPMAVLIVLVQYLAIHIICLPLFTFAKLQLGNIVDQHVGCATSDMPSFQCASVTESQVVVVLSGMLVVAVSMLFYTVIEYLCRQLDHVLFQNGYLQDGKRVSLHRRRLLKIRSHPVFQAYYHIMAILLLYFNLMYVVTFFCYTTLAACIAPTLLISHLFAIAALVYVGRKTYMMLDKLRDSLEDRLAKVCTAIRNSAHEDTVRLAVEKTMEAEGFTRGQILFFTMTVVLSLTVFLSFILVGTSLFIRTGDIVPTLISSGLCCSSAAASINSDRLPAEGAKYSELQKKLTKNFDKAEKLAKKTNEAIDSIPVPDIEDPPEPAADAAGGGGGDDAAEAPESADASAVPE